MAEDVIEEAKVISEEKTKTINVDDLADSSKTTVKVDFMDSTKSVDDFIKRQTKESTSEDKKDEKKDKTQDELKQDLKKEEQRNFTEADFQLFAEFIITALDAGIATICKYYADDTSDSAYSVNQTKKDLLTHQMKLILVKYFTYLRIELLFIFSLLIVYSGPVIKARKMKKAKDAHRRNNQQYAEKVRQDKVRDNIINLDAEVMPNPNDSINEPVGTASTRRRGGRPDNG